MSKASKGKDSESDLRPYNHYNLYFILERELFLQQRGVSPTTDLTKATHVDYTGLDLPPMPARYSSITLQEEWYLNKKKKRSHKKSHGLISFKDMADMVSYRWKNELDEEIIAYVKTIAEKVKMRYDEHKLWGRYYDSQEPPARLAREEPGVVTPSVQDRLDTMIRLLKGISKSDSTPPAMPSPLSLPTPPLPPVPSLRPSMPAPVGCCEACGCVSGECAPIGRRDRGTSIAELDVSDEEILSLWSSNEDESFL